MKLGTGGPKYSWNFAFSGELLELFTQKPNICLVTSIQRAGVAFGNQQLLKPFLMRCFQNHSQQ